MPKEHIERLPRSYSLTKPTADHPVRDEKKRGLANEHARQVRLQWRRSSTASGVRATRAHSGKLLERGRGRNHTKIMRKRGLPGTEHYDETRQKGRRTAQYKRDGNRTGWDQWNHRGDETLPHPKDIPPRRDGETRLTENKKGKAWRHRRLRRKPGHECERKESREERIPTQKCSISCNVMRTACGETKGTASDVRNL